MFCNNCGKQVKDGAKFCPFCGNEIKVFSDEKDVVDEQENTTVDDVEKIKNFTTSKVPEVTGIADLDKLIATLQDKFPQAKKWLIGALLALSAGIGLYAYFIQHDSQVRAEQARLEAQQQKKLEEAQKAQQEAEQKQREAETAKKNSEQKAQAVAQVESENALNDFYKDITDHKYLDAYNMFSDDMKQQVGSYTQWKNGYSTTVENHLKNVKAVDVKVNEVTFTYDLVAKDVINHYLQERTFTGKVIMYKDGHSWKIRSQENHD